MGTQLKEASKNGKHIAIKCTYNNGGEGVFVGFSGTCTEDIIKWNIKKGRAWCSNEECACRKYYDRGLKGKRPKNPCSESTLFRKWKFNVGYRRRGKRAGEPIRFHHIGEGKIAILTTLFPGDKERDQKIIGLFKIAKVINKPNRETIVEADKKYRIRLTLEEAKELYFWEYYNTRGGASWRSSLIRYLNDDQVYWILKDIKEVIRDEKSKILIKELLEKDFPNPPNKRPEGARKEKKDFVQRILEKRKYGPGEEGDNHRELKNWALAHPREIGLTNVKNKVVEYQFSPLGDKCDILFELYGDKHAVVEIETTDAYSGAYQVLKYKVLKCAQLGKDITSPDVEAILVAWEIPKEVRQFCKNYGIRWVEKKL